MELDRTMVHWAAFGGVFSSVAIEVLRRTERCLAEYVGVYAVERGRILGQIIALRLPYTFDGGEETISGISAVATRADRARMGVARTLLEEVHRRELEAGLRYAALWTNRSWGAHRLYEQFGYRDVYAPPWVVHARGPAPIRSSDEPSMRPGRRSDLEEIDRLHDRVAEGRLGYVHRPRSFSRGEVRMGMLEPSKNLVVARRHGTLVGYAHLDRNSNRAVCGELVATSTATRKSLVREIVRRSTGVPYCFQHTLVTDDPQLFRGPRLARCEGGWYGMMAAELGRRWKARHAVRQFGTDDRRFLCLIRDRF